MFLIKFSVKGQLIQLKTDLKEAKVTSDTLNYFKCKFDFDQEWDGFDIRVYFKNASFNITKSAILDNSNYCYIPWEVLAHTGVILCNVTGIKYVDGSAVRLTAGPIKLFVHNPGSEEQLLKRISDGKAVIDPLQVFLQREEGTIKPDYQVEPTPTEFEQYVIQIKEYSDKAVAAENKIKNLTVSSVVEDNVEPSVEKTEYEDHYDLMFTLNRGKQGDPGATPYIQDGYWYINGQSTGVKAFTADYMDLENKPQIEGVTLEGDLSFEDLTLNRLSNTEIEELTASGDVIPIVDPD